MTKVFFHLINSHGDCICVGRDKTTLKLGQEQNQQRTNQTKLLFPPRTGKSNHVRGKNDASTAMLEEERKDKAVMREWYQGCVGKKV